MKMTKRILSIVLCLAMIVGIIPMSVFAADTETVLDAAIFCSDVHGSTSDLTSVLSGIKTSGVDYSSIGFVGDTCLTVANTTSVVQSALSDTDIEVMFSYASSHDTEDGADIDDNWNYSGEVEDVSAYYLVYTIRETDMQNAADASTAAPAFTTWYNGLTAAEKALPIFIMSHRPLHDRRDDNAGAATWYDAISAAADTSDIVFFWGHNHTSESSVDTAAYYVAKDGTETFTVYNGDTVVPNFTYMNAGYINANGQNPARKGIATTVQITASSLIFQDYNSSGEYSGTYAHNVTVAREFAAVEEPVLPETLAVTGVIEYYVGESVNLSTDVTEIVITYTDDSEEKLSEGTASIDNLDYKITDANGNEVEEPFATAGDYTLTYTYTVTVDGNSYAATAPVSIKVVDTYVSRIEITTLPTKVVYEQGDTLDTTGMVVTAIYNSGTTAVVTPTSITGYDMNTVGEQTVTVNYHVNGISFSDTFTITVNQKIADDAILVKIEITQDPEKKEYLVSQSLDISGMVVVATFSDGSTKVLAYDEFNGEDVDGYILDGFNMHVEKSYNVTVSYTYKEVTCTDTFTINVWDEDFTDTTTGVKVHVADKDYGVTSVIVADSTNTHVSSAIAGVITGTNYVAYDITLSMDPDGYTLTDGEKTVTLPIPAGVNNPVVYYVPNDGGAAEAMAVTKGDGVVTFTTTHFSTYVIGESAEITVPENKTATGSMTVPGEKKTVYVLTSTPSGSVLIVNGNAAGSYYALANNNGSVAATGVTIKSGDVDGDGDTETYIEMDDATDELWTVGGSYTFECEDGYLYRASTKNSSTYTPRIDNDATTWSYSTSNHRLSYTRNNSTYYLYYSSGWKVTTTSSSASTIYFYVPQEIDTTTTVSGTCSIAGEDISAAVSAGSTANLSSTLTFTSESGTATTTDTSTTADYEIVTVDKYGATVNGDPNGIISKIENGVVTFTGNYGKALVKVSYTTDFGVVTDYITIEAKAPYYSVDLHYADLTEVASDATFDADATYYIFNSTTKTYEKVEITAFEDGVTYYTTPVVKGDAINETVALKGIAAGDRYPVWAVVKEHNSEHPDGEDLGDVEDDRLYWVVSDTSIATIDSATGVLTFTGNNYGTFTVTVHYLDENGESLCSDAITISATESLYVVPGDGTGDFPEYPNEGAVRFDKTATSVGAFSQTGIAKVELSMTGVPYTKGSEIDVVLMLDMTGSMDDVTSSTSEPTGYVRVDATIAASKAFIATIVKNEDDSYNKNRIGVYVFNKNGAATLFDFGTVDNDTELEAVYADLESIYDDHYASGGTPYDDGLAKCQEVLAAAKTDSIGNDRKQFCVFMTDGVPTSYAYVNGTTYGTHSSADAVAGMLTSDSNYATRDTDYKYEYYSTEMKKAGVTVYSVGVGLFNENNAWDGSATQCGNLASALLNDISGPAGETTQPDAVDTSTLSKMYTGTTYTDIDGKYFFSVDDSNASMMSTVFKSIAQKIVLAATDVQVEDKVGNSYSVIFDIPSGLTADDLPDGQEFYIQVVEYQLNSDKERNGNSTVLLRVYIKDGVADCYTVTTTVASDGTVTETKTAVENVYTVAEDGTVTVTSGAYYNVSGSNVTLITPYFTYTSSETDGEILTWAFAELHSTEMALQYFAYLDGSSTDSIPAGTYYTNEYATLTYTNFNGVEVQQTFPVPQMTWNGAQVSYVFYLVNEKGQPVNRAGRVIPFSEAVYVTDIFTDTMTWNDLEQYESFDAALKAEELLPSVYGLYDQGASYDIHVFENEFGSNLNNHFVIGSAFNSTSAVAPYYVDRNGDGTADELAYTTYVFNAKSDATKYTMPGYYALKDSFWCIGANLATAITDDAGNITGMSYTLGDNETAQAMIKYVEKLDGYTEAEWEALSDADQYAVILINDADYKVEVDTNNDGTIDGYYLYYQNTDGTYYTIVNKDSDYQVDDGFDFANTTVAFAVVWKPRLETDTVVVDFGLDVVVDVITNDVLAGGVVGVLGEAPANIAINQQAYENAAKQQTANVMVDGLKIGTATVENLNSVRFSFDKDNAMLLNKSAVFYYEAGVNYYGSDGKLVTTNLYSSVIIIPAATVYYEDEYVDLKTFTQDTADADDDGDTSEYNEVNGWLTVTDGTATNATQDADRPGFDMISDLYDANNPYGYDSAYESCSKYSLGSAAMVNVYSGKYATAEFEFYGTGFDIISMTSSTTGTILVSVYDTDGNKVAYSSVDTYYGMEKDGTLSVNNPDAIYQVPVIKMDLVNNHGLSYGKYRVEITVSYMKFVDHTTEDGYDFYLDAIRIYDPVAPGTVVGKDGEGEDAEDVTIEDIYAEDKEGWPQYEELRNNIIDASNYEVTENADGTVTVTGTDLNGPIFIDCNDTNTSIADYVSYGPNNELYLANGQAIAFNVAVGQYRYTDENGELKTYVDDIQLGIKLANGSEATYEINGNEYTVQSATDMYHSILKHAMNESFEAVTVTIKNTGDAILSLTNIKVTFNHDPSTIATATSLMWMDAESVGIALMSMRRMPVVEDTTQPEETTPEETVPEETVPEETVPEETVPEETVPEETVPEETVPEETVPEETIPEETIPEETEPETFAPEKLEIDLNKHQVKEGDKVKVTVKTSGDVAYITVNGETITDYRSNRRTGEKTWTITVKAEEAGELDIEVVAYDAESVASDPVVETITVEAKKNPAKTVKDIMKGILGWLFG